MILKKIVLGFLLQLAYCNINNEILRDLLTGTELEHSYFFETYQKYNKRINENNKHKNQDGTQSQNLDSYVRHTSPAVDENELNLPIFQPKNLRGQSEQTFIEYNNTNEKNSETYFSNLSNDIYIQAFKHLSQEIESLDYESNNFSDKIIKLSEIIKIFKLLYIDRASFYEELSSHLEKFYDSLIVSLKQLNTFIKRKSSFLNSDNNNALLEAMLNDIITFQIKTDDIISGKNNTLIKLAKHLHNNVIKNNEYTEVNFVGRRLEDVNDLDSTVVLEVYKSLSTLNMTDVASSVIANNSTVNVSNDSTIEPQIIEKATAIQNSLSDLLDTNKNSSATELPHTQLNNAYDKEEKILTTTLAGNVTKNYQNILDSGLSLQSLTDELISQAERDNSYSPKIVGDAKNDNQLMTNIIETSLERAIAESNLTDSEKKIALQQLYNRIYVSNGTSISSTSVISSVEDTINEAKVDSKRRLTTRKYRERVQRKEQHEESIMDSEYDDENDDSYGYYEDYYGNGIYYHDEHPKKFKSNHVHHHKGHYVSFDDVDYGHVKHNKHHSKSIKKETKKEQKQEKKELKKGNKPRKHHTHLKDVPTKEQILENRKDDSSDKLHSDKHDDQYTEGIIPQNTVYSVPTDPVDISLNLSNTTDILEQYSRPTLTREPDIVYDTNNNTTETTIPADESNINTSNIENYIDKPHSDEMLSIAIQHLQKWFKGEIFDDDIVGEAKDIYSESEIQKFEEYLNDLLDITTNFQQEAFPMGLSIVDIMLLRLRPLAIWISKEYIYDTLNSEDKEYIVQSFEEEYYFTKVFLSKEAFGKGLAEFALERMNNELNELNDSLQRQKKILNIN